MAQETLSTKQDALDLARRGWSVFPVRPRDKVPATAHGCKDASSDPAKVEEMFAGRSDFNIGLATGSPSDLWIVDLDGKAGLDAFAHLEDQHGEIPTTVSSRTGGGGRHLFFRLNGEEIKNRAKLTGEPIDCRGTGGYIVAPPSWHKNGKQYTWENDPDSTPIATAPGWLVDLVLGRDKVADTPGLVFTIGGGLDLADDPGASKGERHDRALRLIGSAYGRGLDQIEVARLAVEWARRCSPRMRDDEVLKIVQDLGRRQVSKPKAIPTKVLDPPPPWRPYPVSVLPDPIKTYVQRSADAIGCDPSYIATGILPSLASAVGTSREIMLKRGWIEPSVLWGVLVGNSGTLKSPAVDIATKHIRDRQAKAVEVHDQLAEEYDKDLADHKLCYEDWKKSGRKKMEPIPEEPEPPICERVCCSDVTVEGLAVLLADNPRGLLLIRDEVSGWLASHDQYKSGRGADTAHWLTIHGARDLVVDRKSGDRKALFVRRASVSICGGIQPKTLARSLGQEHFENGLAARLLLAMPPRRSKAWSEAEIDGQIDEEVGRLFDRLYDLEPNLDGDPVTIGLSAGGKRSWIEFYNRHAEEMLNASGDYAAVLSKLEGGAARIALILHLVRQAAGDRSAGEAVDEQSISAGVTLSRWYASEAARVYRVLNETDDQRTVRQALDLIHRRGGRITANDLRRRSRHLATSEDADRLLRSLIEAGLGSWQDQPPTGDGGRPTRLFVLDETSTAYPYPKPSSTEEENEVSDTDTRIRDQKNDFEEFRI